MDENVGEWWRLLVALWLCVECVVVAQRPTDKKKHVCGCAEKISRKKVGVGITFPTSSFVWNSQTAKRPVTHRSSVRIIKNIVVK